MTYHRDMDTEMQNLIDYVTRNPGASTSDVADHLGLSKDAAYRRCKKHLTGTKGASGMSWFAPEAEKSEENAPAEEEIEAPAESGTVESEMTEEAYAVPSESRNQADHPAMVTSNGLQANAVANMLQDAWDISAEVVTEGEEHTVMVPKRQKRQVRALIFAFERGIRHLAAVQGATQGSSMSDAV